MDVVGSEIGHKMRSAIKAKLTELGCYVDDELPDYVMVMVANKRTRAQMEDDLQLFLGDNTELFVNWLHQVLKKLQEVTITAPAKTTEQEKVKEKTKSKEKKAKKPDSAKKSKKKEKDKVKSLRKKEKAQKKLHKDKKKKSKSSKHEMIHPNVPPLLMNIEKESEPSITDVFAGQILKNHGVIIETHKVDVIEKKQEVQGTKRPILPIIDPSTILSEPEITEPSPTVPPESVAPMPSIEAPNIPGRDEQIKEINEIEAKIQGLKQKLAEQLDSMSEDEDFLNIRTEAEELMNDFADDVLQEISQPPPITPPQVQTQGPSEPPTPMTPVDPPKEAQIQEELPQIELRLPKRPVRERLGAKQDQKKQEVKEKETEKRRREKSSSSERFTPERELKKCKSAKSRLGEPADVQRKCTQDEERMEDKKLTSRVSSLPTGSSKSRCASVVRVKPRPRVTPSSSLLLKAMADAHKSLFNSKPTKPEPPAQIQRATVLPMRRSADTSNIVIEVRGSSDVTERDQRDKLTKSTNEDLDKEEYVPAPITKVFANTEYVPSTREERYSRRDDEHSIIVETINNIHNPSTNKDKDTKFIVTMDGFNPNAFLAKKLQTEGLLDDDDQILKKPKTKTESVLRIKDNTDHDSDTKTDDNDSPEIDKISADTTPIKSKRLSDTSEESDTQVIINNEDIKITRHLDDRTRTVHSIQKKDNDKQCVIDNLNKDSEEPSVKKRKASPIVFSVKKEKEEKETEAVRARERTESVSSDKSVTVVTTLNSNKYDSVPPLDKAAAAIVAPATKPWCRLFPSCKWGSSCAFAHPKCKFGAACSRRGCAYSHPAKVVPAVASHVIPAANFKSITAAALPTLCKYFPNCVNPTCHYYHPKPCRYGKACMNKIECNFYHSDVPNSAIRYV